MDVIYSPGAFLSRTRLGVLLKQVPPPTCYVLKDGTRKGFDGETLSEHGKTNQYHWVSFTAPNRRVPAPLPSEHS